MKKTSKELSNILSNTDTIKHKEFKGEKFHYIYFSDKNGDHLYRNNGKCLFKSIKKHSYTLMFMRVNGTFCYRRNNRREMCRLIDLNGKCLINKLNKNHTWVQNISYSRNLIRYDMDHETYYYGKDGVDLVAPYRHLIPNGKHVHSMFININKELKISIGHSLITPQKIINKKELKEAGFYLTAIDIEKMPKDGFSYLYDDHYGFRS